MPLSTKIASVIRIQSLGFVAHRLLQRNRGGKVLAVFRRSFYLQTDDGNLICVGSSDLGAGPLHMLTASTDVVNWQQSGLRPGFAWRRQGRQIVILPLYTIVFEYSQATIWSPKKLLFTSPQHLEQGLQRLRNLLCQNKGDYQPVALGDLIADLIEYRSISDRGEYSSGWLSQAIPAIKALIADLKPPSQRLSNDGPLRALLGLGPGLTPSGDDFIAGLLMTLLTFSANNAVFNDFAARVLNIAPAATNTISLAHLRCAAEGAGSAALLQMLAALAQADERMIQQCLPVLVNTGHSSGWDMLAGLVCGCVILLGKPKNQII